MGLNENVAAMRALIAPIAAYTVDTSVTFSTAAPASAPAGIADHANTLATLITRPSKRFGTMAWRSELVLMFSSIAKPLLTAQRTVATGYECVSPIPTSASPETTRPPSRLRRPRGPAAPEAGGGAPFPRGPPRETKGPRAATPENKTGQEGRRPTDPTKPPPAAPAANSHPTCESDECSAVLAKNVSC